MSGKRRGEERRKRVRMRWHDVAEEEVMAKRREAVQKDRGWKRSKRWAEEGAE